MIADSEAKINEVNESLENQILDKIQVEEKIDEFKDEIQKKNSEVKGKKRRLIFFVKLTIVLFVLFCNLFYVKSSICLHLSFF